MAEKIAGSVKSADGVPIHYTVQGSGEPTLVFVHGWCCDQSYWEPQLANFARKHRVVTIDLAGHGKSGVERKSWTMAAFGGDVAAVAKKLDLKRAILIGHSMGGPVVVEAARQMPERVIGLVGVDTFQDLERKNTRMPSGDRLARLRDNFVESSREIVKSMFVENSDPKLAARIIAGMSSAPPDVGLGAMQAMGSYDLAKAIEDIKVPIQCICSDYRPFDTEAAQRHASSFKVAFMSGVGHFVMLEDPGTFNNLLAQFIGDL
jgi:pimeloyl-ACP methyl ester carboxylesterase